MTPVETIQDMRFTKILVILLATLTIFGCRKDIDGLTTEVIQDQEVPILEDSGFSGLIIDENGQGVSNAIVDFATATATTDENGFFRYSDIQSLNKSGSLVSINKEGYYQGLKFVYPQEGNKTYLKVMLIEKKSEGEFDAANGGIISVPGASVEFKSNSIVDDATLQEYNGIVEVYFHFYNTNDPNIGLSMPGDLRGVNTDGKIRALASFGMAAVELIGENGQKLNLKENTTATLSLNAPDVGLLPESMPMWYMDEMTGFWMQDGVCELVDGTYVAQVSHFSFWNCDAPYELINLTGTLVNFDNEPIANAHVRISLADSGVSGYGNTNTFGQFTGKVPKGQELVLTVITDCGTVVDEFSIGSFDVDTVMPDLQVENSQSSVQVTGQVVCNGAPLSQGYVKIVYNESNFIIAELEGDGSFNETRILCDVDFGAFTAVAYNTAENFFSEETEFILDQPGLFDLGIIDACTQVSEEWMSININNQDYGFLYDVSAHYGEFGLQLSARDSFNGTEVYFEMQDPKLGNQNPYITNFLNQEFNSLECQIFNPSTSCVNMNINIGSISRQEGDFITGTFSGILYDGDFQYELTGDFNIRLDSYTPNAIVKGRIWEDLNNNGIQDQNENGISTSNIILIQNDQRPVYSYGNGEFQMHVLADQDFQFILSNGAWIPTLENVGDDALDSDISNQGISDIYTLSDQAYLENIGFGLIEANNLECTISPEDGATICFGESLTIDVEVFGGIPPYSYTWNTGEIGPSITVGDFGGTYIVTVVDAVGAQCINETTIYVNDILILDPVVTPELCNSSNGSINFDVGTDEFSIYWPELNSTELNLTDLQAGTYTYILSDFNGCSTPETTIEVPGILGATIGNQTWLDVPNGTENLFDTGDEVLPGVTLNLWDEQLGEIVDVLISDSNGNYLFTNVQPGMYYIEFIPPTGYTFLDTTNDLEDAVGSDADPETGLTPVFNVECDDVILYIDAGFREN